jgi:superoxide dismutase, Cu-Zn family
MRHLLFGASLATIIALPAASLAQDAATPINMINTEENEVGTVTINTTPSGMLHLIVEMTDLPPGPHGFHIHETGQCDPASGFESAGGHYAGDHEHGVMVEGGPHAGDFPNVHVGQDGVLKAEFFTDRVSLAEGGENPLRDEDGSALVVHADPDDYSSQPSGEAGDRLACGVIE